MAKPYSQDLRNRVIDAVETEVRPFHLAAVFCLIPKRLASALKLS